MCANCGVTMQLSVRAVVIGHGLIRLANNPALARPGSEDRGLSLRALAAEMSLDSITPKTSEFESMAIRSGQWDNLRCWTRSTTRETRADTTSNVGTGRNSFRGPDLSIV